MNRALQRPIMNNFSRWEGILEETHLPADKDIDRGILSCVHALRRLRIPTIASCEGHLNSETPFPWIEIGIPMKDAGPQAARTARLLLLEAERRLWRSLDKFYRKRRPLFPERLHIFFFKNNRWGVFYLQSIGAQMTENLLHGDQRLLLKSSRREFDRFTSFLNQHR